MSVETNFIRFEEKISKEIPKKFALQSQSRQSEVSHVRAAKNSNIFSTRSNYSEFHTRNIGATDRNCSNDFNDSVEIE